MDETTNKRSYSLNVQIAQLLDPEFDYEAESIANTERYQRLVRDYEHDFNAVVDALPENVILCVSPADKLFSHLPTEYIAVVSTHNHEHRFVRNGVTRQQAASNALLAFLQTTSSEPSP